MNEILVDVIVPVYNVEPYLDEFFTSLKKQTNQSFRIIVVYDESQDNSLEIIEKYKSFFKNRLIIIVNQTRSGLAHARNVALDSQYIKSKYFSFLDPDDTIENTFFEKLINSIESNDSDIVVCGFNRCNISTNTIVSIDMVNNPTYILNPSFYSKSIFFNIAVWNKLYRTEKFSKFRFDEIKRCEDLTYFLKVFSRASKISFINEPLYHYAIREGSLIQTFDVEHLSSVLSAVKSFSDTESLKDNYDFVCGVLFIRLCLGVGLRIYSYNKTQYKESRNISLKFLNKYFPNWNKTKYLSFRTCVKNGKKAFLIHIYKFLFRMGLSKNAISFYLNRCKKKNKEIHW